jgi:iron complex outermembrane recepter protein
MLVQLRSLYSTRAALAGTTAVAAVVAGMAMAQADTPPANAPANPQAATGDAAQAIPGATQVADADGGIGLETVVVTARKRAENVQDVPVAVTAIGGARLDENGTSQIQQLQFEAPGLVIDTPNPRQTTFAIRGLGNNPAADGLSASVGLYIDGVYLDRPGMANFDLLDIDHVEVLRGPQGTLFGKNTTAGAVSFNTLAPDFDYGVKGEVSLGDFGLNSYQASVTGPVSDTLAFRLTAYDTNRDGYLHDINTGQDLLSLHRQGLRGQLLWKPSQDLSWRLIGELGHENDSASSFELYSLGPSSSAKPTFVSYAKWAANVGTPVLLDPQTPENTQNGFQQQVERQWSGTSLLDWDEGDFTISSVTGWRKWTFIPHNDFDWSSANVIRNMGTADYDQQFSQELRIASPTGGQFDYVAGLYYFWRGLVGNNYFYYGSQYAQGLGAAGNPALNNGVTQVNYNLQNNSYAAFGQGTWHFDPQWDLTVGARETYELAKGFIQRLAFTGGAGTPPPNVSAYSGTVENANFTPSGLATLSYKPAEQLLTYATISYGEKAGGFNPSVPQTTAGAILPISTLKVRPEQALNYEIGAKDELLDNRLIVNLAAYWTDVFDYQANTIVPTTTGALQSAITNVGAVRSQGVEAEVTALPLEGLRLDSSLAYNNAYYRDFLAAPSIQGSVAATQNLSGHPVVQAPRWTFNLDATYTRPITDALAAYVGADLGFKSSYYGYIDDSPYSRAGGYGVVDLRTGLTYDHYDLSLWLKNAGDAHYYYMIYSAATGSGGYVSIPAEPRMAGITLKANF